MFHSEYACTVARAYVYVYIPLVIVMLFPHFPHPLNPQLDFTTIDVCLVSITLVVHVLVKNVLGYANKSLFF